MGLMTIERQANAEVVVPSAQYIAISNYGGGIAEIYYLITNANRPPAYKFQQTLENNSVTLGPFSIDQQIKIAANDSRVIYDIGASPDLGIGDANTLNGKTNSTSATANTIAERDSSADLTARRFISGLATGTSPLSVTSTTVNTNLNADLLDGLHSATAATASTIAARDSNADLTARRFISGLATGTSPLSVSSTTVNTNLNADLLDGQHGSYYEKLYPSIGSTSSKTNSVTLTPAELETSIIRGTPTADATYTLPLAADMTSYFTNMGSDTSFIVSFINSSSNYTITINTNDWSSPFGSLIIHPSSSSYYKIRKTSTNTWILYCLSGAPTNTLLTNLNQSITGVKTFSVSPILAASANGSDGNPLIQYHVASTSTYLGSTGRNNLRLVSVNAPTYYNGTTDYTLWHAGNDGASSGLDADLLDGQHGSYYAMVYKAQATPTAKTASTTLTGAEWATKIITANGAAGAITLQLPTAADMDTAFPSVSTGYCAEEVSVINISTTDTYTATITTNTGWTLVGDMVIIENDTAGNRSSGKFLARKTGTAAWTLYRTA